MNNQIQDKYNKVKAQTKTITSNSTYLTNIMLAIAAILALLIYYGTIMFSAGAFTSLDWWLSRACESLAISMLLVSLSNIYYERQRQLPSFLAAINVLEGKVFCCNDNQESGTYNGVMHVVNEFNRKECERLWRRKLRSAVGSLFGNELAALNKDFSAFDKLTDEWWENYFDEKEFKLKRRLKIMRVVRKIRNNDYKIKSLITVDAVLYDIFNNDETVSPVYKKGRDMVKGITLRILTLMSFAALLASVFLDEPPNLKGWIYSIITRTFMIMTTFFMSYSLGQKMSIKRRNALHKRLNLLESAFNFCNLPNAIRAIYYDMSHKLQTKTEAEKEEDAFLYKVRNYNDKMGRQ